MMFTYFSTNLIITAFSIFTIYLLKQAPARIRLYICLVALLAWLVPWSAISLPTIPKPINIVEVMLPAIDFSESFGSKNVNVTTISTNESFQIMPTTWLFLLVISVAIFLLLMDLKSYLSFNRNALARSTQRNDLWEKAGFSTQHCEIRCLSGEGPGMATGIKKSIIWLDNDQQDLSMTQMVLLHELTHIQQKDPLILWALIIMQRLLWWNPLIWLGVRYARQQIELSCDERCKRQLPTNNYRDKLIEIILENHNKKPPSAPILGISFKSNFNVTRIQSLTEDRIMKNKYTMIIAITSILACWVGLSNAASLHSNASQPEANNTPFAQKINEANANNSLPTLVDEFRLNMDTYSLDEQVSAKVFIANFFTMEGKFEQALKIYTDLLINRELLSQEQVVRVLNHSGNMLMSQNKYQEANTYWYQLIELDIHNIPEIKANKIAVNHYLSEEYELAIDMLNDATASYLAQDKPIKQTWLRLQFGLYFQTEQTQLAIDAARSLMEIYPSDRNQRQLDNMIAHSISISS